MPLFASLKEMKVKFKGNWTVKDELIFRSCDDYFVYDISVMSAITRMLGSVMTRRLHNFRLFRDLIHRV